jgi:hypothetical protein
MIHDELTQLTVAIDSVKNHPRNIRQGDVGAISQSLKESKKAPVMFLPETTR